MAELPNLSLGISKSDVTEGAVFHGLVGEEEVIVTRIGEDFHAISAKCTHYHGPLAEGLVVDSTVRCPWHHACFDLRTGEALRAPALDPIACWNVEDTGEMLVVKEKKEVRSTVTYTGDVENIVIVGGGGAALAAIEMLKRMGYDNKLVVISSDNYPPCDRPNLSKDFLAGSVPEEWLPLRGSEYYASNNIDLLLNTTVVSIDTDKQAVYVSNGESYSYDKLLIATGAEPIHLNIPGEETTSVHYLRSVSDCKAIIETAEATKANSKPSVLIVGSSFIGLEAAASMKARGIEVHVVAPEKTPLEKVMGDEIGTMVRDVHEQNGVQFHLEATVSNIKQNKITLSTGQLITADFLIVGVGVRPLTQLAESAGLRVDNGVVVDEYLESSVKNIYAAGDVARWFDPRDGGHYRAEHWVAALRQGQTAAKNLLGMNEVFSASPFFWSQHFDVVINFTGHSVKWDSVEIEGSAADKDCKVTYLKNGKPVAVATVNRDLENLESELAFEKP